MRIGFFGTLVVIAGCTSTPDSPPSAPADGGTLDAATAECSSSYPLVAPTGDCSPGKAVATGMCVSNRVDEKSDDAVCFVSPAGPIFFAPFGDEWKLSGDGWTFTALYPSDRPGLTPPPADAQKVCDVAFQVAGVFGGLPACSAADAQAEGGL